MSIIFDSFNIIVGFDDFDIYDNVDSFYMYDFIVTTLLILSKVSVVLNLHVIEIDQNSSKKAVHLKGKFVITPYVFHGLLVFAN